MGRLPAHPAALTALSNIIPVFLQRWCFDFVPGTTTAVDATAAAATPRPNRRSRLLCARLTTMRLAVVLALLGLVAAAAAEPVCRTFTSFTPAVSERGTLLATIAVPDQFSVASVRVANTQLGHPAPATLELSLLHKAPNSALASSPLQPEGSSGAYVPTQPLLNAGAAGQWALRVADTQPGAENRLISLGGWALTLCPSDASIVATAGPTPTPTEEASMATPDAANATSPAGNMTAAGNATAAGIETMRVAGMSGDAQEVDNERHAARLLNLLFPGAGSAKPDPDSVFGMVSAAKAAGDRVVVTHITDAFDFAAKQSELYKSFVNKKLSDLVGGVEGASSAAQAFIGGRSATKLSPLHTGLLGALGNLKASLAADAASKVESAVTLATRLGGLGASVSGDLKSTTGLLGKLVVAKLAGVAKLYTTVEGLVKTHVDNTVAAKAAFLDALLDKIIAGLSVAQGSRLTGPIVDIKVQLDAAKLGALREALDILVAALRATPTPSQAVAGKVAAFGDVLKATHVAELLRSDFEEPVWTPGSKLMAPLLAKVDKARSLLDAAEKEAESKEAANNNDENNDAEANNDAANDGEANDN